MIPKYPIKLSHMKKYALLGFLRQPIYTQRHPYHSFLNRQLSIKSLAVFSKVRMEASFYLKLQSSSISGTFGKVCYSYTNTKHCCHLLAQRIQFSNRKWPDGVNISRSDGQTNGGMGQTPLQPQLFSDDACDQSPSANTTRRLSYVWSSSCFWLCKRGQS